MVWLTAAVLFLVALLPPLALERLMRSKGKVLSPVLTFAYIWAWFPLITRAMDGRPPLSGGTWIECPIFLLIGALFGYFMPAKS